ncbi:hypothetical protein AB0G34_29735 [Kitasatospora aureofaciens]|uniref:Uncharacterized protein n=2 Tax=Kitasatospora aureofaciens TaxID=1894 RepID=A0A1E7NAV6_KITAU|nr:hypothetical protein [Kitasatospora aureofaciens]OEV37798.1 hypothetical protein HS99_0024725 [Kitasatospora aureofaciens]
MGALYGQWQQILAAEYFGPDSAEQSIAFYVDDEVGQELAQRPDVTGSLPEAVREELDWARPEHLMWRLMERCRRWESRGRLGAPPSLPVLACSVLAATKMASSDGMRRSNYYGRWAQLFGERPGSPRAERLEGAFEEVVSMWQELDRWLEDAAGLYGASTISTDGFYRKIGYPLSQALIRASDREALTRFFSASGVLAGNPVGVPGRELLRRLRLWVAGRDRNLSPRLLEEVELATGLADNSVPLLAEILFRLASQWDGTLHEPGRERRRKAAPLRLVLAGRGERLEWTADVAPGLNTVQVGFPEGRSFLLKAVYGGVYSGLESVFPSDVQLRQGVHLTGDELVLDWSGREVILLRMHERLGEWVSTEYFEPGAQHLILAAPAATAEVRAMALGLQSRPAREVPAPVPGWKLFKGVRAFDGAAFGRTLARGGEHIHVLEPPVREQAELIGGLRILREYRAGGRLVGHYLRGGEPDLLLPTSTAEDGRVTVVLNDRTERLAADSRVPFPLRVLRLEEGEYTVGTPDAVRTFTVSGGISEGVPAGTGSLACVRTENAGPVMRNFEGQPDAVRGAAAPAVGPIAKRTMVPYSASEAYLLGVHGSIQEVRIPGRPDWIASRLAARLEDHAFEVPVPDGYVWLLVREQQRWSTAPLLPYAVLPPPTPPPDDYQWAWAVLNAADCISTPIWEAYVRAAREISGRGDRP